MSEKKNQPSALEAAVPGIYSQTEIPHGRVVANADQLLYDLDNASEMSMDDEQHELNDDEPLIPLKK